MWSFESHVCDGPHRSCVPNVVSLTAKSGSLRVVSRHERFLSTATVSVFFLIRCPRFRPNPMAFHESLHFLSLHTLLKDSQMPTIDELYVIRSIRKVKSFST